MIDEKRFKEWLKQHAMTVPLCEWGPDQTTVAVMFARDMAASQVRRTLDEALNSGDGAYRP